MIFPCSLCMTALLRATSTPPLISSAALDPPGGDDTPSSAAMSLPPAAAMLTGARNRMTSSPCSVTVSSSSMRDAGSGGRFRMPSPVAANWLARTTPLASRTIAPTTSVAARPAWTLAAAGSPLAERAPCRSWVRSGLSSVRSPYFALYARFWAM
jgi:hypothetical protein